MALGKQRRGVDRLVVDGQVEWWHDLASARASEAVNTHRSRLEEKAVHQDFSLRLLGPTATFGFRPAPYYDEAKIEAQTGWQVWSVLENDQWILDCDVKASDLRRLPQIDQRLPFP